MFHAELEKGQTDVGLLKPELQGPSLTGASFQDHGLNFLLLFLINEFSQMHKLQAPQKLPLGKVDKTLSI